MNIIFSTQGVGLDVLFSLYNKIKSRLEIEKVGFYVANSQHYNEFCNNHLGLDQIEIVKEWEIEQESESLTPDLTKLCKIEKKYGDPTLWDSIVCDRRVYLGRRCKERQDYKPAYTHKKIQAILQVAIEKFEIFFSSVEPNVILGLDPVTYGDYLLFLMAKKKNIPMLFFRASKIENYLTLHEGIFGCSAHIKSYFDEYQKEGVWDEWIEKAEKYLSSFQKKQGEVWYEGMISIPVEGNESSSRSPKPLLSFADTLKREICYQLFYRRDSHIPGILGPVLYKKAVTPVKKKLFSLYLMNKQVGLNELEGTDYIFYPLQSEPEISTLIWGKSCMNHIEVIRNVARSIPVSMKLVVKEHPRSMGYRTISYYKKILEIPNVLLVDPAIKTEPLVKGSKMVVSVATFVSFEAVLYKVPTIMLGGPRPFTVLPEKMIRYVDNINGLPRAIDDMLTNYVYQEKPVVHYVAATMKGSVPVSYFNVILKKRGRLGDADKEFDSEIEKMAVHVIERLKNINFGMKTRQSVENLEIATS